MLAAVDSARLIAEPVSLKTRSGRAKAVSELPSAEIACPAQNSQKSIGRRGAAVAGVSVIVETLPSTKRISEGIYERCSSVTTGTVEEDDAKSDRRWLTHNGTCWWCALLPRHVRGSGGGRDWWFLWVHSSGLGDWQFTSAQR